MGRAAGKMNTEPGKRLKEWLNDRNLKQYRLADVIHVMPQTVNRWCNGRSSLRKEMIELILQQQKELNIPEEQYVREEWLTGVDEFQTEQDRTDALRRRRERILGTTESFFSMCASEAGWGFEHEGVSYKVSGIDVESGEPSQTTNVLEIPQDDFDSFFGRFRMIGQSYLIEQLKLWRSQHEQRKEVG